MVLQITVKLMVLVTIQLYQSRWQDSFILENHIP